MFDRVLNTHLLITFYDPVSKACLTEIVENLMALSILTLITWKVEKQKTGLGFSNKLFSKSLSGN